MGSRKKKTRIPSPSLYTKFAESLSQTKSFILEWIIICSNSFARPRQFQRWNPGNELGCYILGNGQFFFFKELVLNKNTPLETMKGLQRVHLELTKCCLLIDTFFLSCSVAQFVDIVKLHSLWTGTSALSATLMRYYAVYQFSYVMCRTRDSVFITYQTPRRELIKLFFGKYFWRSSICCDETLFWELDLTSCSYSV